MKISFPVLTVILLCSVSAACVNNPPAADNTTTTTVTGTLSAAGCNNSGGKWVRGEKSMFYGCLRQAKDAGKSCTDSTQCQFHCNARPGEKPKPGQPAVGQCQATNSYGGCNIEISKGLARKVFCTSI
ncbi:MAG: hypothetical protein ACPGSM_02670 [Thiolinea sp.]